MRILRNFRSDEQGVAMIEFAIAIPVILALVIGSLEFGTFFLKSQQNNHNIGVAAQAVIADPGDPSNKQLLTQNELLNDEENIACAKSFLDLEAAQNGNCARGQWDTLPPQNMPDGQTAYFVLIKSSVKSESMTGLFLDMIPANTVRQVVKIGGAQSGGDLMCNGDALEQRSCVYAIENYSITTWKESREDGGDRYANIATSRTNNIKQPTCSPNGWSCNGVESFLRTNNNFNDRVTYPRETGGSSSGSRLVGIALSKNGSLPTSYAGCTDHRSRLPNPGGFNMKLKIAGFGCWTGN